MGIGNAGNGESPQRQWPAGGADPLGARCGAIREASMTRRWSPSRDAAVGLHGELAHATSLTPLRDAAAGHHSVRSELDMPDGAPPPWLKSMHFF
jgi:hypothetical protein